LTDNDFAALGEAVASDDVADVHAAICSIVPQELDRDCCGEGNMDTIGALVDKLVTVNLKMWHNQEVLYEIRRMTKLEFKQRWGDDLPGLREVIKRCCDLNVQRGKLIDEVDRFLEQAVAGEKTGDMIREQHKTY